MHAVLMSGLCSGRTASLLRGTGRRYAGADARAGVRAELLWPEGMASMPWEAAWCLLCLSALWVMAPDACRSLSEADAVRLWGGAGDGGDALSRVSCTLVGEGLAWVGLPCLCGMAVVGLHVCHRLLRCGVCGAGVTEAD